MIGPHQDRELELMLTGKKPFSFDSMYWWPGQDEPPMEAEKIFLAAVSAGKILRFERQWLDSKGRNLKVVCYTQPSEAWRADAYFWIRKSITTKQMPYDEAVHIIIGRLLGYKERDIQHFLRHAAALEKKYKKKAFT